MGRWHNHYVDGAIHFCTSSVQDWQPRLDDAATLVLYEELDRARRQFDVRVLAYVVMPDHIHLLAYSESGERVRERLQQVLSRSSKRIGEGGKFGCFSMESAVKSSPTPKERSVDCTESSEPTTLP